MYKLLAVFALAIGLASFVGCASTKVVAVPNTIRTSGYG